MPMLNSMNTDENKNASGLTEDSTCYLVCLVRGLIIKLHSTSLKRLEISFFAEKADTTCDFDQTDVQCEM